MRHQVPFVGEGKVIRASDEPSASKRASGKILDSLVGDAPTESSWEDVVPSGWRDHSKPPANLKAAGGPVAPTPSAAKSSPVTPKPRTTTPTPSGAAQSGSIDWQMSEDGRAMQVSIVGSFDRALLPQWRRLQAQISASPVKRVEVDLAKTSELTLTGMGMLLLLKERYGKGDICLYRCNKNVAELLQWAGMERYFVIIAKR